MKHRWTKGEEKLLLQATEGGTIDKEDLVEKIGLNWNRIRCKLYQMGIQVKNLKPAGAELTNKIILVPPNEEKDEKENNEKDLEIEKLKGQIRELLSRKRIHAHKFFDKQIRIGLLGDTQLGSLYERLDVLEAAYDVFEREGIKNVYHCGDLLDGEKMYRGHEYEIHVHGADSQVSYCVEKYPQRKGITTHFILGNHDISFWKHAGLNVGWGIINKRKDMNYLGREEADIVLGSGERTITMRLSHPGKGTAYALSYHPQKYIESLTGGQKPHIVCFGHYHKAELLPCYRNIFAIQTGCIQSQTPFMRTRNIAAHIGFWILEFTVNEPSRVSRFKSEFFAIFEEGQKGIDV